MKPFISVIMPVYNGTFTLERALQSLASQTLADWELVAADDGSTDQSYEILERWAAADSRIKLVRLPENCGAAAARNAAIRGAKGEMIAFLDRDDEYYPQYLAEVHERCDEGDVLMFGYDFIYDDGPVNGRPASWDPARSCGELFLQNIIMPLGAAHRRAWWEKVGGFHEGSWQPDWDYWRRLFRAGARFAFPQVKSGRYHVRLTGMNRTARVTHRQSETFLANWQAGKSIYGDRPLVTNTRPVRKVAFISGHCAIDSTNGAATSTLDGLKLLRATGMECMVLCCSRLDAMEETLVEDVLAERGAQFETRDLQVGSYAGRLIFTSHGDVPVTLFRSALSRGWSSETEIEAFGAVCERFLAENRPDVVWTYGGDQAAYLIQRLARRLDIPVVFALHNFCYYDPSAFIAADQVIVFSEYSRQFYWDTLKLACQKLPLVVDPERVQVPQWQPQYVTFVNPELRKGVLVFVQIAEQLWRRRPDIPLLMVEGVATARLLAELGIDLGHLKNLKILPNTPHPREFYALTKILLMPSLMEPAGLVAMEAMMNGIPVLAGKRGGLPEMVGEGGQVFDIPSQYTLESRVIPTAEEVEPWVQAVIRLWDDAEHFEHWGRKARVRGESWHPDRLAPVYGDFFRNICPQPGPPLVPQEWPAPADPTDNLNG